MQRAGTLRKARCLCTVPPANLFTFSLIAAFMFSCARGPKDTAAEQHVLPRMAAGGLDDRTAVTRLRQVGASQNHVRTPPPRPCASSRSSKTRGSGSRSLVEPRSVDDTLRVPPEQSIFNVDRNSACAQDSSNFEEASIYASDAWDARLPFAGTRALTS